MTRIRSPFVFAVSLVLLGSAAWLGLGADSAPPDAAQSTSDVRLRGHLLDATVPASDAWAPVQAVLSNATMWMDGPDASTVADAVLVTGLDAANAGAHMEVLGTVVYEGPHPDEPRWDLVVVAAHRVTEPAFAW